jgi:hypothetical protein
MKIMIFSQYINKAAKAALFGVTCMVLISAVNASTIRGAGNFEDQHIFTKKIVKFGELVSKHNGDYLPFELSFNDKIVIKKNYVMHLNKALASDYNITAFSNVASSTLYGRLIDKHFLVTLTSGNNTNE